eukprot:m.324274 g.324274  ORF g.324274 m.324274 type:complete len:869 (+) comp55537_c0_seq1:88-2694(+)
MEGEEGGREFEGLCGIVVCSSQEVSAALAELGHWKDDLLAHNLPANVLLRLLILYGRLHRATVDLQVPLVELVRLVKLFAQPWQRKSIALQRLNDDYDHNKRQLDLALKRVTTTTTDVEKLRTERLYMQWERLFAKLLAMRRHSRRWKFLVDSFHDLMREGKAVPVVSDPDDDSDDDGEPPLPEKPSSKKNSKNLAAGKLSQRKPGEIMAELRQEVDRLTKLSEHLQTRVNDLVSVRAVRDVGIQLDPPKVEAPTYPFQRDLNGVFGAFAPPTDPHQCAIHFRVKQVYGFGPIIPADIICLVEVAEPHQALCKDRTGTTVRAVRIRGRDAVTIDQTLALHGVLARDEIRVQMVSGVGGPVLATTTIPASAFVQAANGVEKRWLSDDICSVMMLDTTINARLQTTADFAAYLREARGDSDAEEVEPELHVEFGVAVVHINDEIVDTVLSAPAVPMTPDSQTPRLGSRRRHRLRQAIEDSRVQSRSALEPVVDQEESAGVTELFNTLDVAEDELTEATFTMQEMMELAVLHATQMKLLEQDQEQAIQAAVQSAVQSAVAEATEAAAERERQLQQQLQEAQDEQEKLRSELQAQIAALESARAAIPKVATPKPVIKTFPKSIQTDPLPPPEIQTKIVIERVEVPVEVRVEVPVYIEREPEDGVERPPPPPGFKIKSHAKLILNDTAPDDFLRRLQYFMELSMRRRHELVDRVRAEERRKLEQQLDCKFLLADPTKLRLEADVCLPAIFMPSPGVVYSPRAAQHWHPSGSNEVRFSQPPTVVDLPEFKLPGLNPVTTNLYSMVRDAGEARGDGREREGEHAVVNALPVTIPPITLLPTTPLRPQSSAADRLPDTLKVKHLRINPRATGAPDP